VGWDAALELENTMKKLALAAVAALATTALTGASAVPAAGVAQVQTKRFVAHQIDSHPLDARSVNFAAADVDRHAGHVIGYDSMTGYFHPKQHRARFWVSFALKNGAIAGVVTYEPGTTVWRGRILNGTGQFKGINGTMTARPLGGRPQKTHFTLTYHF
jgi:hypothetical protein